MLIIYACMYINIQYYTHTLSLSLPPPLPTHAALNQSFCTSIISSLWGGGMGDYEQSVTMALGSKTSNHKIAPEKLIEKKTLLHHIRAMVTTTTTNKKRKCSLHIQHNITRLLLVTFLAQQTTTHMIVLLNHRDQEVMVSQNNTTL